MRDMDAHPYTADEQRVCEYIQEITGGNIGCGDDPIGFLIAAHRTLAYDFKIRFRDNLQQGETNE